MYSAPADVSLKLIALVALQSFAQGQHHANSPSRPRIFLWLGKLFDRLSNGPGDPLPVVTLATSGKIW